jgi:hypothetical protein
MLGQEWWAILILLGQAFLQSGKSRVLSFCLLGKIREKKIAVQKSGSLALYKNVHSPVQHDVAVMTICEFGRGS